MIIWVIGMSGAGKTTIASRLTEILRLEHSNLVFLDGDILRDVWGENVGHSVEGRRINAHRISHLCHMLDRQDIHVVAAVLSIFPEWQAWNRENFSQYFEVFVDVPMTVLEERDYKGLYAKANAGEMDNVVGKDISFPRPENPDLIVENHKNLDDPSILAERVAKALPSFESN